MKISVDGGALNPKNHQRYGTAVFSENLVKALQLYDKKNKYFVYTFRNIRPKLFWLKARVSLEELKQKNNFFLALNQASPLYTSGKVISFCHGLSYHYYTEYYSKKDVDRLSQQLEEMIKRSEKIIVSSQKVKQELVSIYRYIETRVFVSPFGIPFDMKKGEIKKKYKYFIFVGMNHPIKNIDFIKQAFNEFKKDKKYYDYKLKILTKNISRKRLKDFYQHATALLTASHYESFSFPVLEALSQGCPVIGLKSAIIPELKSYVNMARDLDEFIEKMKEIKIKPSVQSINQLYEIFNWKNYVYNLVRLY
ncbi:MAG: glycosyltransferase [Patescibacteria group bacterium]